MGWAARAKYSGRPNRAWGAKEKGIRTYICVHCGGKAGQKKQSPLVVAGNMLGRKVYIHDACLKKLKKEAIANGPKP